MSRHPANRKFTSSSASSGLAAILRKQKPVNQVKVPMRGNKAVLFDCESSWKEFTAAIGVVVWTKPRLSKHKEFYITMFFDREDMDHFWERIVSNDMKWILISDLDGSIPDLSNAKKGVTVNETAIIAEGQISQWVYAMSKLTFLDREFCTLEEFTFCIEHYSLLEDVFLLVEKGEVEWLCPEDDYWECGYGVRKK
jgi:hypothetical protein